MGWLRDWRRRRRLRCGRRPAPEAWALAERALPGLRRLDPAPRQRLADTAVLLRAEKAFQGLAGAAPTAAERDAIALQAAVPILELGLDGYAAWTTVLVYPADFVATHEYEDEAGVVHTEQGALIGEAWEDGPLVLSLESALAPEPGSNVVIHECAHKLDMRQGAVNGLPPLPRGMPVAEWAAAFEAAYATLRAHLAAEEGGAPPQRGEPPLDPYAAEDPGEFFAVASEAYFADPDRLRRAFPAVYQQLARFYGWAL